MTLIGDIPENLLEPYEQKMASANGVTTLPHVVKPKGHKLISQRWSFCKSKIAGGNIPGGGLQLTKH